MELSVMSPVLGGTPLKESIEYLASLGVDSIELGVGGYPGKAHADAVEYAKDLSKAKELKDLLKANNMKISALACHGNPVHPTKEEAMRYQADMDAAYIMAEQMEIDTIVGFSGCPGDCKDSKNPNWVTCAWPNEYLDILKYQWEDVLIPYWTEEVKKANRHGVKKIAFEMHPGFCVYNPSSLMKLRNAVGETIGANFDPSHLFWQGIDPVEAIKYLGKEKAIYHFHAKDTKIDEANTKVNGVLDTGSYGDILNRSWVFRTVGYGHDASVWNDIISTLKAVGYEGCISIEHEDGLMSSREGLEKAVEFLKKVIIYQNPGEMWWV